MFCENCKSPYITTSGIAEKGHLDCLKYAHSIGKRWFPTTTVDAAKNGHLDCLKYAHENGCRWDISTIPIACEYDHLDCIKYAHKNGCLWGVDDTAVIFAAKKGYLDCLKYLIENGCPIESKSKIIGLASENGHLDCLKYLHENGFSIIEPPSPYSNGNILSAALLYGHLNCAKYILQTNPSILNNYIERFLINLDREVNIVKLKSLLNTDNWWRKLLLNGSLYTNENIINIDLHSLEYTALQKLKKLIQDVKEEIKTLQDNSIIFYTRNNIPKDVVKYTLFSFF
jgi:hypothetical protein